MKKMLFGLIATVMLSASGNANQISNLEMNLSKHELNEQPKVPIKISIDFGRKSKECSGFGICKMEINFDLESAFKATSDLNGNLILETNYEGIDQIKRQFDSTSTITIEEDFQLSDEICKSLDLKLGYIIKSGKYNIKNTSKGVFNVTL